MQCDDGTVISAPRIIKPRSRLLWSRGGVTGRQAGYNSQVIDIQIICAMTSHAQHIISCLMVNCR